MYLGLETRLLESLCPSTCFSSLLGAVVASHLLPSRHVTDTAIDAATVVSVVGHIKVAWVVKHVEVWWWPSLAH